MKKTNKKIVLNSIVFILLLLAVSFLAQSRLKQGAAMFYNFL